MPLHLEGETELDGGWLSALSEAYLTTNPCGMFLILHVAGVMDSRAWQMALRHTQRHYPLMASSLKEVHRHGAYRLCWQPLEKLPDVEVRALGEPAAIDGGEASVRTYIQTHLMRPFDLTLASPVRLILLRQTQYQYALILNVHP